MGCGHPEERVLLTGLHAVADIYCECCKTTLGWKYVSDFNKKNRAIRATGCCAILSTAYFVTLEKSELVEIVGHLMINNTECFSSMCSLSENNWGFLFNILRTSLLGWVAPL